MKAQKKWIIITAIAAASCLALLIGLLLFDDYQLELNEQGQKITVSYGSEKMPEITGICKGKLILRKGFSVPVKMKGTVDLHKLGEYPVTFTGKWGPYSLKEDRIIVVADTTPPEIKLVSSPDHYTNPAHKYAEEGFTAIDNCDGDITSKVVAEEKDGSVIYTVEDSAGNKARVERKINYKDLIAPVINLTKGTSVSFNKGKQFTDPGYQATDECDGDLTSQVKVEGTVDGMTYGTYQLTYTVTDSSGNVGRVQRTVKIADISAPVITLKGPASTYIKVGTQYTDPGFTASDNMDGDLTAKVSVSGSVNTSRMGQNTITYTVSDAYGNKTTVSRIVFVYEKQLSVTPVNPGNKVVYLTFDDGPSRHTARLLNILDKYGVKATFFVTNQFPAYQHMIGETSRRGHTIALHTYSHVYKSVYASEQAYYQDLDAIKRICVAQTGKTPTIVRFPGGTSNTVSRNYCRGIMTTLTKSISYHGYLYCDWNVSSGDAGGAKTKAAVYSNVIRGIQRNKVSVVLQHDITSHSVEAVEDIIFWGLTNGYTFLPMSETTPMVHFAPMN